MNRGFIEVYETRSVSYQRRFFFSLVFIHQRGNLRYTKGIFMQNSYCVPVEVDGTGGKRDRGGLLLALLIFEQRSLDTRPEAEVLTLWMRFMMIQTGKCDKKMQTRLLARLNPRKPPNPFWASLSRCALLVNGFVRSTGDNVAMSIVSLD